MYPRQEHGADAPVLHVRQDFLDAVPVEGAVYPGTYSIHFSAFRGVDDGCDRAYDLGFQRSLHSTCPRVVGAGTLRRGGHCLVTRAGVA